jgi:hypothetical protein
MICIAGADIEPTVPPAGIVALNTDIPSDTKKVGLFFKFIPDTLTKR